MLVGAAGEGDTREWWTEAALGGGEIALVSDCSG